MLQFSVDGRQWSDIIDSELLSYGGNARQHTLVLLPQYFQSHYGRDSLTARFVRFLVFSYHGNHGSLGTFGIVSFRFEECPPSPSTVQLAQSSDQVSNTETNGVEEKCANLGVAEDRAVSYASPEEVMTASSDIEPTADVPSAMIDVAVKSGVVERGGDTTAFVTEASGLNTDLQDAEVKHNMDPSKKPVGKGSKVKVGTKVEAVEDEDSFVENTEENESNLQVLLANSLTSKATADIGAAVETNNSPSTEVHAAALPHRDSQDESISEGESGVRGNDAEGTNQALQEDEVAGENDDSTTDKNSHVDPSDQIAPKKSPVLSGEGRNTVHPGDIDNSSVKNTGTLNEKKSDAIAAIVENVNTTLNHASAAALTANKTVNLPVTDDSIATGTLGETSDDVANTDKRSDHINPGESTKNDTSSTSLKLSAAQGNAANETKLTGPPHLQSTNGASGTPQRQISNVTQGAAVSNTTKSQAVKNPPPPSTPYEPILKTLVSKIKLLEGNQTVSEKKIHDMHAQFAPLIDTLQSEQDTWKGKIDNAMLKLVELHSRVDIATQLLEQAHANLIAPTADHHDALGRVQVSFFLFLLRVFF
jgi:hypothetical protein